MRSGFLYGTFEFIHSNLATGRCHVGTGLVPVKDILDNYVLPILWQQFAEELHVGVMVRCSYTYWLYGVNSKRTKDSNKKEKITHHYFSSLFLLFSGADAFQSAGLRNSVPRPKDRPQDKRFKPDVLLCAWNILST